MRISFALPVLSQQVPAFTPQLFSFTATGPATLLTLASLPSTSPAALTNGPAVNHIRVNQTGCGNM